MVRLLLKHGAKPAGARHDWRATINCALRLGNRDMADQLIRAGADYDPVWYDAAFGQLDDLRKRGPAQPLDAHQVGAALGYAADAGQVETFDWLLGKLPARRCRRRCEATE